MDLASFIDHTALKNTTTKDDIAVLCGEAIRYRFAAVCVPAYHVRSAARLMENTAGKVATVIGFPFGYHQCQTKLLEASQAIDDGADELDLVMNLAAFKSGDMAGLENEIAAISGLTAKNNKTLKVIIESGVLTDEEIIKCCDLYSRYPVQFLKTSTGFAEKGASVHAVHLMRKHLPPGIEIKASGGIRTKEFARELIEAGATRLGYSASVAIVSGETSASTY